MTYLILTVLLSTVIIIIFKVMGLWKIDVLQAITFNYFFASVTGFLMIDKAVSFGTILAKPWIYMAIISGAFFIMTFFLFALSTRKAGVSITAVSSKMSVILPVTAGFLWFGDTMSVYKLMGIVIGLSSFYFIFYNGQKVKPDWRFILIPLLLLIGNGMNDTLVKYTQVNYLKGDEDIFIQVVFTISLIFGGIYLLVRLMLKKETLHLNSVLFGLFLGAINFFGAYTFLKSMGLYQASFLFPVVNVSVVVLSSLVGVIAFKEVLKRINIIGVIMATIAILLISVG